MQMIMEKDRHVHTSLKPEGGLMRGSTDNGNILGEKGDSDALILNKKHFYMAVC